MHDVGEGGGHQTSPADQSSVNLFLLHQSADVLRLYRPAVDDAGILCSLVAAAVGELMPDERVGGSGNLR